MLAEALALVPVLEQRRKGRKHLGRRGQEDRRDERTPDPAPVTPNQTRKRVTKEAMLSRAAFGPG
jgi:hypothetical protein